MITITDLRGENSQEILKTIIDDKKVNIKKFFLENPSKIAPKDPESVREWGLAGKIRKRLKDNQFDTRGLSDDDFDRTINRWLDGANLGRFTAYQICIALDLGLEKAKIFFNNHLRIEFAHFNDWREILYYYCIQKGYDLNKTRALYKRCVDEIGLDEESAGIKEKEPSITILTSIIKNAYDIELLKNDELFITYMKEQKENFHNIRGTRRVEIRNIINELKNRHYDGKRYVINSFADAFYEDDDDYNNYDYFKDALDSVSVKKREKNLTREFFILCMLMKGMNSWEDIDATLTIEKNGYPGLDENNIFDACVIEACEYYKRTKGSENELTAYERFCDNMKLMEYERPEKFAFEN